MKTILQRLFNSELSEKLDLIEQILSGKDFKCTDRPIVNKEAKLFLLNDDLLTTTSADE